MENQINVGDQNDQQIGQNSVSQSVINPGQPKINYFVIAGIILVGFIIFGVGGYCLGKTSLKPSQNTSEIKNQPTRVSSLQPTSEPTVNPAYSFDPVANWKTYNKNFSDSRLAWPVASIKYPADWTYSEKSLEGTADKLITFSTSGPSQVFTTVALQLSVRNFKDDYGPQSSYLGPLKEEYVNSQNQGYHFQNKYGYIDAYYILDMAPGQTGYVQIQLLNENYRKEFGLILSTFRFGNPNQRPETDNGYPGTIKYSPKPGSPNDYEYRFFNSNGFPVSDMSGQGQKVTEVPLCGITENPQKGIQNQVKSDVGKSVVIHGTFQYFSEAPYLCVDRIQD